MRATFGISVAALFLLGISGLAYAAQIPQIALFGDLAPVLLSFFAAACWSIIALKTAPEFESEKLARGLIAVFLWLGFLGESFWAVYELVLNIPEPTSMLPDLFWQVSYLALIAGLVIYSKTIFIPRKVFFWCNATFITLAVTWIATAIVDHGLDFGILVQELYVFWDLIALGLVLAMLLPLAASYNHFMTSWMLFLCGILGLVIFDMLFAALVRTGSYAAGSYIDIIYLTAYTLMILAADSKYKTMKKS